MSNATVDEQAKTDELPLMGHLLELRNRLLKAVVLVVIFFAVMFPFSNELYLYLSEPLRSLLPEGSTMIATTTWHNRSHTLAQRKSLFQPYQYHRHLGDHLFVRTDSAPHGGLVLF